MGSLVNELSASVTGTFPGRLSESHSRHASVSLSDMARAWQQGNRSSLNLRPSRASSVISTRTKASIGTVPDDLGDAVDVHVSGGVVYRIGLDGRIISINNAKGRTSVDTDGYSLQGRDSFPSTLGDSEADLVAEGVDNEGPGQTAEIGRTPSFTPGRETLSVARRRSVSNPASDGSGSRTASAESVSPPIRRRGGIRPKVGHRESSGQSTNEEKDVTPGDGAPRESTESSSPRTVHPDRVAQGNALHLNGFDALSAPSVERLIEDVDRRFKLNEHESVVGTRSQTQLGFSGLFHFGSVRTSLDAQPTEGGNATAADAKSPPVIVTTGPSKLEEGSVGDRSPPPMDTENDISIHYSRIIRSIDASHRSDIEARDQELAEARDLLGILARQAVDIKAELIRTKGQVAAMSDPAHLHKIGREETIEAQSFSFPPLKLKHVRTLKLALKRRAEKMRRGMDDDLGWLLKRTTSAGDATPEPEPARPATTGGLDERLERKSGKADPPILDEFNGDEQVLLQSLLSARRQNRALEAEKRILEAQVVNLRESMTIWKDRCQDVERRQDQNAAQTPELSAELAKVRQQVEETWLARWRDRNDQLTQRMRRIDEEAQRSLQQAIRERDAWIVRCADISNLLRQRDEELARLKRDEVIAGTESTST